ncbi:MAG: hypothetical protein H8E98_00560 [Bacteroidetes bacterium]|nr:hypothetical protein [Bacteroidota bacterium]
MKLEIRNLDGKLLEIRTSQTEYHALINYEPMKRIAAWCIEVDEIGN